MSGKNSKTLRFIDLFAGIGGFHVALHDLGCECVFASEIDKFARETYSHNFKNTSPKVFRKHLFNEDINDQDISAIPDFDILCAGFPCQPFSYAGKNEGFNDKVRGTLFFNILKILEERKPRMFILENVKGLKSHQGGNTLKTIEQSLGELGLGYTIYHSILNSYDFGLPQYRERWYCVGFLDKVDFTFPEGNRRGTKLTDIIDIKCNDPKLRLSNFEIERIRYHFANAKNGDRVQHDNSKYEPHTKKGRHGVYSFQKKDGSLRFHIGDVAKTQIQEAFYACLQTYAPTIIANRVPKLWDIERRLSVNESKVLQGFPKDFEFPVSDVQAYKQLGNSVSVPVVKAVAAQMIRSYESFSEKRRGSTGKRKANPKAII